jgi:hypothetical protein
MLGRITRTSPREATTKEFDVPRFAEVDWHPRYNVAPSQIVEAIISNERREAIGADALGLRLAHRPGAEARAHQRTGRDRVDITDPSDAIRVECGPVFGYLVPLLSPRSSWCFAAGKGRR